MVYDLAVIKGANGDYSGHFMNLEYAKRLLEEDGKVNTAFYALVLEEIGKLKTGKQGNSLLEEAAQRRALLNISSDGGPALTYVPLYTDYSTSSYMNYVFSLYNKKYLYDYTNFTLTCRGRVTDAEKTFFFTYYPYFSKNILELAAKTNLSYYENINRFLFPQPGTDNYQKTVWGSYEEERLLQFVIEKYQYVFSLSSQGIKARTMEGRLFDANLFLAAAINHCGPSEMPTMPRMLELNIFNRRELQALDAYCREKNADLAGLIDHNLHNAYMDGRIIFVDIGPALANARTSAVTTLELARDFPKINFIALDLPEQVGIFNSIAFYNENKRRILTSPNIYILPGDGMKPIADQLFLAWNGENKPLPRTGDEFIILRCANSLDVYFPWDRNKEYLERAAMDFKGNPLLVFHNKVVLYKSKGSLRYRFIGMLSDAGFDHLYDIILHNGDMPFKLFPIIRKTGI